MAVPSAPLLSLVHRLIMSTGIARLHLAFHCTAGSPAFTFVLVFIAVSPYPVAVQMYCLFPNITSRATMHMVRSNHL